MNRISMVSKEIAPVIQKKPVWCTSKMGYTFDSESEKWQLDGSITINLGRIRDLDFDTKLGLKKTLCRYAEELSAATVSSTLTRFNMFCDHTEEKFVTVSSLSQWRSSLTPETECWLGALKAFLLAWHEWGFSGISDDVVKYLVEQKLSGATKGKAVRSSCPYSGPLTMLEQGALLEWVSNAYNNQKIELSQYAFFLMLLFTGRRAVQVRSLRTCDLVRDSNGKDFIIQVPRVKQRGIEFRKSFNPLNVNEDLFLVLERQSEVSHAYIEKILNLKLSTKVKNQIPVFLENDRWKSLKDLKHLIQCLELTPDFLHMTTNQSMAILRDVSVKNRACSERTGEFINFTSRRFRYTKGTNLARRGITGVALATALDHSDTQHIDVYTQNTEEMAEQIDAIMTPFLAPLAQAFAGVLINSERDALRANDPHSRVRNGNTNSVGNCGTHAFCASGYRACYTCINFQPWRDAPHEEVLEEIHSERQRQIESGVSSNVIQSTDRLLLAVQQVVFMCNKAISQSKFEVSHG